MNRQDAKSAKKSNTNLIFDKPAQCNADD